VKINGWIPLDKNLVKALPRDRPFTELEAMFSLSVDFDNKNLVTLSGYSSRWGWNRKKVKAFFEKSGIMIEYQKSTKSIQNQRGQIKGQKRDRKGTDKGQISFIDLSYLKEKRDRKGTEKGQKRDRSRDTTLNPISSNLNPKSNNGPPYPHSRSPKMLDLEKLQADSPELKKAFRDCRDILGLSGKEIEDVFSSHSETTRFAEAVQFTVEKTQEKGVLEKVSGFIVWAYKNGKTSMKTREAINLRHNGNDLPPQAQQLLAQLQEDDRKREEGSKFPTPTENDLPEGDIPF
jgi:hypothetical protein